MRGLGWPLVVLSYSSFAWAGRLAKNTVHDWTLKRAHRPSIFIARRFKKSIAEGGELLDIEMSFDELWEEYRHRGLSYVRLRSNVSLAAAQEFKRLGGSEYVVPESVEALRARIRSQVEFVESLRGTP